MPKKIEPGEYKWLSGFVQALPILPKLLREDQDITHVLSPSL